MKHPKPWKVSPYALVKHLWFIEDANGGIVLDNIRDQPTALEIVAAVNLREKLVEALKKIDDYDSGNNDSAAFQACRNIAFKALSEGGGE